MLVNIAINSHSQKPGKGVTISFKMRKRSATSVLPEKANLVAVKRLVVVE